VTPNEHDEPTVGRSPEERANGSADGTANGAATPVAEGPTGAEAADEASVAGAHAHDEVPYDDYVISGANPFSSVHPQGAGLFPRLLPREFPEEEEPADVPVMEQLPDPNALPGYPDLPGYQQAFPSSAPAFPPAPAFPSSAPAFPPAPPAPPAPAFPPDPPAPAFPPAPPDPYHVPRSPDAAPPLPGTPGHWSDVRAAPRGAEAPPLTSASPASSASPEASSEFPAAQAPRTSLISADSSTPWAPGSPWVSRGSATSGAPGASGAAGGAQESDTIESPPHSASLAMRGPSTPPVRETADSLTADLLLHGKRPPPGPGWRRTVYRATGGLVRVGESSANLRRRDLVNRVRTPVAGGHHRVAVMSLKGGVGKTTTAVGLGATLASLRGDRVIAMDANPDRGTLSDKVRLETSATVRDLLNERAEVTRYADVRAYTSQASSRLEILASDRDPGVTVAFSADDYRAVARVLEHYYSICITDCGTGLLHSAMSGILELADHIVLVSSPSVDGARSASATLDWLEAHDYADLVRNGVVVLSTIRPRSKSTVDLDRLEQHFAARCRAVVRIPYDAHLEEGAEVELELLSSETAEAYLQLAALVGDGFAVPRRAVSRITPTSGFA
jgi:MinD-like ATPase involved in chromosome partitioning or flagellar assembly